MWTQFSVDKEKLDALMTAIVLAGVLLIPLIAQLIAGGIRLCLKNIDERLASLERRATTTSNEVRATRTLINQRRQIHRTDDTSDEESEE